MAATAWILGAGPGIGRAAALRVAAEGYQVGCVIRPGEDADAYPGQVVAADVGNLQALSRAMDALEAALGLPSLLLFNASTGRPGPAAELEPEALLEDLTGSGAALLLAVQRVLPALRRAGRGTLLVTGGGLAFAPKAGLASASAGKALQRSLALSLAEELAPEGIHVATLAVCGFVQPHTDLSPEAVAQALWELHLEPPEAWTRERRLP